MLDLKTYNPLAYVPDKTAEVFWVRFKKECADAKVAVYVNFAATSPAAREKKSTFTGNEAHPHGHEVHREQRGFCPSAP